MRKPGHATSCVRRPAGGSLLPPVHAGPDRTASRQRGTTQPSALDGGLEAIRPQKANIDTPVGWTQPVGDSAKTGHRTSGSIESAEIIGLDTLDASAEGVKHEGKFQRLKFPRSNLVQVLAKQKTTRCSHPPSDR